MSVVCSAVRRYGEWLRSLLALTSDTWQYSRPDCSGLVSFGSIETLVDDGDLVAIFHSIHRVMKAEKILKLAGLAVRMIPVPRQLTSDCGLALRFSQESRVAVEENLATAGLEIQELYLRQQKDFVRIDV